MGKSDIEGTRDDNTMNIEGEGAEEAGRTTQQRDDQLQQRSASHGDRRSACDKYGHLTKHYRADDGKDYPVTPGVCRTCGSPM